MTLGITILIFVTLFSLDGCAKVTRPKEEASDSNRCQHISIPGCCQDDLECSTSDPCMRAVCSDNECTAVPLCDDTSSELCCVDPVTHVATCRSGECCIDSDCADPANRCRVPYCNPVNGGTCELFDRVCDDSDPCTVDSCNTTTGDCIYAPMDCDDDDLCTDDSCHDGICSNDQKNCTDTDPCTVDSCDPATGKCRHTPLDCDDDDLCTDDSCHGGICSNDQKNCSDTDPCTVDSCRASDGQCVHPPKVCDDTDPCTVDTCVNGDCVHTPKNCEDGDFCTTDVCVGGTCLHPQKVCDDTNPCTDNLCVAGVCVYPPKNCDDGNGCTVDSCVGGTCLHPPKLCDDSNSCTTDTCVAPNGTCRNLPIPGCCHINEDCKDNNLCTVDSCVYGICENDWIYGCCLDDSQCDDGKPCTTDTCNLAMHKCVHAPISDCCLKDCDCDDRDICTTDSCVMTTHKCKHVVDPTCCTALDDCLDGDACTLDKCNYYTHKCTHTPYKWGCKCHNSAGCAYMSDPTKCQCGYCDRGICRMLHTCDDEDPKTKDTCTADGRCIHTNKHGTVVLDTELQADLEEARLWAGMVVDEWHNEATRSCGQWRDEWPFSPHHITCPDDLFEYSVEGAITSTRMSCKQFQDYIALLKEPALRERGCGWYDSTHDQDDRNVHVKPKDSDNHHDFLPMPEVFSRCPCDDDDPCTVDTCNPDRSSSERCFHFAKNCDDDNECTDDTCVEGVCRHVNHTCPTPDIETCTEYRCFRGDGMCYPSVTPKCEPPTLRDACMISICEEGTMIIREIDCNDHIPCTVDDCVSPLGICTHTPKNCDDGISTTFDTCNVDTGQCRHLASRCVAPDRCHANWTFSDSVCSVHTIVCNDNNLCTTDSCSTTTGCIFAPKSCPTDDPCIIGICNPDTGNCAYIPKICDDGNPCTEDECNPVTGVCEYVAETCSDDDPCTEDICNDVTGDCSYLPRGCNDNDACTIDECVADVGCVHTEVPCMEVNPDSCRVKSCDHLTGEMTFVRKDCSDDNACTIDTCRHGDCRNRYPRFNDTNCRRYDEDHHRDDDDDEDDYHHLPRSPTISDGDDDQQQEDDEVPFPRECRRRHHHHHHHDDDDDSSSIVSLELRQDDGSEEERHHRRRHERECRDWDCMEYVCLDHETGRHEWVHKDAGESCHSWDSCHRFECDGCGYCNMKPGAPEACLQEEDWQRAGIILVAIFIPLGILGCIGLVALVIRSSREDEEERRKRFL